MTEAVRSARGSQGVPITASEGSQTPPSLRAVGCSPDSDSTANSVRSSASSSLSVDGVISTLLRIASEKLRVGGRLVFFAPHRDQDRSARSSLSGRGVSEGGGAQGLVPAEGAAVIAVSAVSTVPASLDVADGSPKGPGNGSGFESGIELKMTKRKAFKKRAKAQALPHPDTPQCQVWTSPCLSPLSFLPPLPPDLVLVECHQQVMSPTFSRWLCVMQKVEVETKALLTGGEGA